MAKPVEYYNDLMYKYLDNNVKLNKEETSQVIQVVNKKVEDIVKYIHEQDDRFKAKPKKTGSYPQGLKVEAPNEFDFNILLDGFDDIKWGTGHVSQRYYKFNRDIKLPSDASTFSPEWWLAWAQIIGLIIDGTGMSIWYEILQFQLNIKALAEQTIFQGKFRIFLYLEYGVKHSLNH